MHVGRARRNDRREPEVEGEHERARRPPVAAAEDGNVARLEESPHLGNENPPIEQDNSGIGRRRGTDLGRDVGRERLPGDDQACPRSRHPAEAREDEIDLLVLQEGTEGEEHGLAVQEAQPRSRTGATHGRGGVGDPERPVRHDGDP